jgi:hypothetical protein
MTNDFKPPFKFWGKRFGRIFFISTMIILASMTFLDETVLKHESHTFRTGIDSLILTVFGLGWIILFYLKPDLFKDKL